MSEMILFTGLLFDILPVEAFLGQDTMFSVPGGHGSYGGIVRSARVKT